MGRYLALDNPKVDGIMTDIVAEIASHFRPRSIIIAGGFGRGEASVVEENGRLRFLSDCEFTMMSGRGASKKAINQLSVDLNQKTGLEIVMHNSILLQVYDLLPWFGKVSGKVWRPSIQHYDLKHSSQVVFGENILARLPDIKPRDIPLWEGIRLMFNRMAEALKYFPVNGKERDESIYWINKVILACQDTLLLSVQQYHSSYKSRNLMFQDLFPQHFSELNQRLSKFLSLASRATDYKLRPAKDAYPEDLLELWFDTVEICDQVFRYIIKQDMDITFDTYTEFQRKYLEHPNIRKKYYLGVISSPVARNLLSAMRMIATRSYRFPSPKLIQNIRKPWKHIVYSLIPPVYFGLSREGRVDEVQLNRVRNIISLFKQLRPQNQGPVKEWRYIKEQAYELWRTLCY